MYKPCNQDSGNIRSESLRHLSAANVGNAVQGQVHEGRVAAGEVVLDGIIDEANQVTVWVHQHWDKQVTLKEIMRKKWYFCCDSSLDTYYPTKAPPLTTCAARR